MDWHPRLLNKSIVKKQDYDLNRLFFTLTWKWDCEDCNQFRKLKPSLKILWSMLRRAWKIRKKWKRSIEVRVDWKT